MRRRSRSILLVTVLLLVAPAVGFSCELASSLACGPEVAPTAGVQAPPCHGLPDMAMDCCSIQAPVEPPATSIDRVARLLATMSTGPAAPLALVPEAALRAAPTELSGHTPDLGRYALFSSYLL